MLAAAKNLEKTNQLIKCVQCQAKESVVLFAG